MNRQRRRQVEALRTVLDPVFAQIVTLTDNHAAINEVANAEAATYKTRCTPEGYALNSAERGCRKAIQALRALDDALFTAATGVPRKR